MVSASLDVLFILTRDEMSDKMKFNQEKHDCTYVRGYFSSLPS